MQRKTFIRLSTSWAAAALLGTASLGVQAQASGPVLLGVPIPMTGPNTQYGDEVKAGLLTALEMIKAAGGTEFKPEFIDEACEPKQAVPAANRVITSGAKFAVAHVCSGITIPASKIYEHEGIVAITPGATSPLVTDTLNGHYFFRTIGRDDQQGPFAAKFMAEKIKPKAVAVLHDKQTYGSGLAQQVKATLDTLKVPVVMYDGITVGDSDYSAVITKLKSAKVDAVFFGGYYAEMGLLLRQAKEQGLKTQFMGPEGVFNQELVAIAGPGIEGMMFTFPADFSERPENKGVLDAFKKAGRSASGAFQMPAYAAVQVLDQAIKAVGADPKKVADYMHANKFNTVIGEVAYDKKGDLKDFEFVVYQLDKAGKRTALK